MPGRILGSAFELYGQYSESEVDVMRVFLRGGNTSIDVGANIGDLTLPMSQLVGPGGRVYAIESHIENFQVLNANLALNGISNVKAINAFIADTSDVDMAGPWGSVRLREQNLAPADHVDRLAGARTMRIPQS